MRYLVSDIGSITVTHGSGNKIVTWDGRTHFVWQDHTTGNNPAFIYHDGPTRDKEGDVTQVNVYFVSPKFTA